MTRGRAKPKGAHMAEALRDSPANDRSSQAPSHDPVSSAVAEFGRSVAEKLGRGGDDEAQLRGPVEVLLQKLGQHIGFETVAYGEVTLRDLKARPDYAVDVGNRRVGYIELKAPRRGVPPDIKLSKRERTQWEKLCALPNLIYTDGLSWRRYHYGEAASPVVRLGGSLTNVAKPLHPVDHGFELLIRAFIHWEPEQPRTLNELIRIVAGLCRLLRDEVTAVLSSSPHNTAHEDLTLLADDWRELLFPDLNDNTFSDAYAQTIVFAMLLARVIGIKFDTNPLHEIARQLGKKHSLIGKSFAVLIDSDATEELRVIETLRRVIGAVDWAALDDGQTNIYIELYERFLGKYDPALRKKSGSYYTPEPVARFMVDFVSEILRDSTRLNRPWGFASEDVIVVDPAMGTGTFLVEIVRAVAEEIDNRQGRGARPAQLRELFQKRLVGFERQVAPYAVAELRLHQALKTRFAATIPPTELRFLTDALEDPNIQQERLRAAQYKVMDKAHTEANRIKREIPVMVMIGNPPHVEHTKGHAPWIEERRRPGHTPSAVEKRPSMDEFRTQSGGRYESDLYALHWYFWRWALWKVFDAHTDHPAGIVAFITPSSYTTGKAFAGMRKYLRQTCDEGWIIDVSPEGNRSDSDTRIFSDVQRKLCIGIFARYGAEDPDTQALIYHLEVSGSQEEKIAQLQEIHLDSDRWNLCERDWQRPFLPSGGAAWDSYAPLCELMPWTSRGITTGRAWAYAPDPETLASRWRHLLGANIERRRHLFKEGRDRKLHTVAAALPGFPAIDHTLATESGPLPTPIRVGYRSFDRQWLIADNRLMEVPRPPLWTVRSDKQVYVTEQHSHPITKGPGVTFTGLIPDIDHYNGRSGRVLPLYRDSGGRVPNLAPGLLEYLTRRLRLTVSTEDVLAYVAAIVAHPGYTEKFHRELRQPGIHLPLTSVPALWGEAVEIGRQVIWLHTYGERYVDDAGNRPFRLSGLTESATSRVLHPIPDTADQMPDDIKYDSATSTLHVGSGTISPVPQVVWDYEVAGLRVVRKWLDYRRRYPVHKRKTSELDHINTERWSPQFTNELLELLAVLANCIALEPAQVALLDEICRSELVTVTDLTAANVLPPQATAKRPPAVERPDIPPLL